MKICFVGWAWSMHTKRYMEWFANRGYETHLITNKLGLDIKDTTIHLIKKNNSSKSRLKRYLTLDFNIWRWQRYIRPMFVIKKLIKKINPDLLHLHTLYYPSSLGIYSNFRPLVIMPWNGDVIWKMDDSIYRRIFINYALKKADAILYNSLEMYRICTSKAWKKTKFCNFDGVDLNIFRPGINTDDLRNNLSLKSQDKVILSTRSLAEFYNIKIVLKASAMVMNKEKNVKLILCWHSGEQNQIEELKHLAEHLGIKDNVIFYGQAPYEEMPKLYNMADVLVSLSSRDSCPMSMLEAMACGTPVVMGDLPQIREWIRDGENGYIVPCLDDIPAAEAMIKVFSNKEKTNSFIKNNLAQVWEKADFDKNMMNIEALYWELVAETKKS
jgi:glycosyltransferase involved in cell wall biosynthesis